MTQPITLDQLALDIESEGLEMCLNMRRTASGVKVSVMLRAAHGDAHVGKWCVNDVHISTDDLRRDGVPRAGIETRDMYEKCRKAIRG